MKRCSLSAGRVRVLVLGWLILQAGGAAAAPAPEQGVAATFTSSSIGEASATPTDLRVLPRLQWHTPQDQPPTPFLNPGPFRVVWDGYVSVDLRSEMVFRAEVQGAFTLELNGTTALSFTSLDQPRTSPLSGPVRLSKGTNVLRATLISPPRGDTRLRLVWGEDPTLLIPIPEEALSHSHLAGRPTLVSARSLRRARHLALEHHCFRCHGTSAAMGLPEESMEAPSLAGIGARRRFGWMVSWIENPAELRPQARMPRLLHGPSGREEARAMAAYLVSLTGMKEAPVPEPGIENRAQGSAHAANLFEDPSAPLYEAFHCDACHQLARASEPDPAKISLADVMSKFKPGRLEVFLRKPEAHYPWIGMPNFQLTTGEARSLADFLADANPAGETQPAPAGADLVQRGRVLLQTTGCLNCHPLDLPNRYSAPGLADLKNWSGGCLAPPGASLPSSRAPRFPFAEADRKTLGLWGSRSSTLLASLARVVPAEFAEWQTEVLQCRACHGERPGFPGLDGLGGKLKPEWTERLLGGRLDYRARPWLRARMPVWAGRAGILARGLAQQHGFPPQTPSEPPIDSRLAGIGHQLVGKEGGFSCVSCHAVNDRKATEVFEAEGINLGHAVQRLLKPYYHRWLLNPLLIDPQTKMPMYFDQGLSPLTEILDGSAHRQIDAMWHYLRLGPEMPAPDTGAF